MREDAGVVTECQGRVLSAGLVWHTSLTLVNHSTGKDRRGTCYLCPSERFGVSVDKLMRGACILERVSGWVKTR